MKDAAQRYLAAGLCVLPALRDQKRPTISWKPYQKRLPTADEVDAWFANAPTAICILCGRVSGNLELLDFDQQGALFDAWCAKVRAAAPGLVERLVIARTQNDGRHVAYRVEHEVSGNMKLAQRKGDDGKVTTLIETRGQGGLFLCAPTEGYELLQGDLCDLPTLTSDERETLLACALELNEYMPPVVDGPPPSPGEATGAAPTPQGPTSGHTGVTVGLRPGDDFSLRGDVRAVLQKHGWALARPGENEYWRRPGKAHDWSATFNGRVFFVFSSNAAPFEQDEGYSPFAVYARLEHGGSYEQAARTLRSLGYGSDGPTGGGVDISALVRMSAAPRACASDNGHGAADDADTGGCRPEMVDPGPMPAEMLRVPGFVSEVMDHCLAIAPYPNPVMAFGGALSLQGFLAGRRVRDSGDNRTNLYLLGLAHSGAGKDQSRKVNSDIIHAIGLGDCLGQHFASGEGIQDALFLTPCMLFQTDEIDGMLQSINKSRDARHEAIMSTMLTMYSSANSFFPMRRKAGKESPGVIDQPCLGLYGTAIPNHYYEALSERMLTNGFFARMIILEAGPRAPGQEPSIRELPPRVLATARWWADYRPGTGNLQDWHPVPTIVEHAEQAKALLIETRLEAEGEYSKAEAASDAVGTTVWGRVSEQTRKLALIYAISEDHLSPRISLAAVQWASRFVMHQTRRMLFMAATHVADGEFDALLKRTVEILRQWRDKHGPKALMPEWELRRRLKQRPGDFKDIVVELDQRHLAIYDTQPTATKPKTGYRLL